MKVQIREIKNTKGIIRYQAVIQPYVDGKVKTFSLGTYATALEAEVQGAVKAIGFQSDPQKKAAALGVTTLASWAEKWLKSIEGKRAEGTESHYAYRMKAWVLPSKVNGRPLGQYQLSKLTTSDIDSWLNNMKGVKGGPLSNQTKRNALAALMACLSAAVKEGALLKNPARGVTLDLTEKILNEEKKAKRVKVWNHEQVEALVRACEGTRIEPLIIMGLCCGFRPGETQGLRWDDFDWTAEPDPVVWVRRSRTGTPKGTILTTSTKTGEDRPIRLEPDVVWRMVAIQERQKECFHGKQGPNRVGILPPCNGDCEWVFTIEPSSARKMLEKLCGELGIPYLSPHKLRHTANSLMGSAGIGSAARAEILGHSIRMNEATYSHAMPKDVTRATAAIARLVFPPKVEGVENDRVVTPPEAYKEEAAG